MDTDRTHLEQLIRARAFLKQCLRDYLYQNDWLEVTVSTITSLTGACETIATVFILPYFGGRAHLAQTGQLQLEMLVKRLKTKVWTCDRSFRAEPRITPRHLTEFTLFELEAPRFTLADICATQEAIMAHCIECINQRARGVPRLLSQRRAYLDKITFPLPVCEYADAIGLLREQGHCVEDGANLGMSEETALLRYYGGKPFFVVHYPSDIKYFNMKRGPDGETVHSVDLLAPPFGEISGGAEREDDFARVKENLKTSEMWREIIRRKLDTDHFEWYLDLWKDGSPGPRGGCGIGFERFVAFFSGLDDVRHCTEFVRNKDVIFP